MPRSRTGRVQSDRVSKLFQIVLNAINMQRLAIASPTLRQSFHSCSEFVAWIANHRSAKGSSFRAVLEAAMHKLVAQYIASYFKHPNFLYELLETPSISIQRPYELREAL